MRIAVIGTSGSGKTTLARRLGACLSAPVVELDAINWEAGWRDLSKEDPEELARRVEAALAGETWVTDGNYRRVLPGIVRRATDVVWLDYDRWVVMRRVIGRSVLRSVSGEELWPGTGNREDWRRWLDRDHPIRWAWATHRARRERYQALLTDPRMAHGQLHWLRKPRDAESLMKRLIETRKEAPSR